MATLKTMSLSPCLCLLLSLLASTVEGLEILDPEEVEYVRLEARGVLGGSVTLDCGSAPPTIFIWAFAAPAAAANAANAASLALAYDYGHGAKLRPLAVSLGVLTVPLNTSSLRIERLPRAAEGTYTCQALYDTDEGAKIAFYSTRLRIEEE